MEKAILENLYWKEKLSIRDLAKRLNSTPKTIRKYMNKFGVKRRELSQAAKLRCKLKPQSNPGRKGMPKNPKYGKEHFGFKGGYIRKDGYKVIYVKGKQILEHRYVWEKQYGKIPIGCHIHHINGNKLDNRIKNLQMMTNVEHQKARELPRNKKGQYHKN